MPGFGGPSGMPGMPAMPGFGGQPGMSNPFGSFNFGMPGGVN